MQTRLHVRIDALPPISSGYVRGMQILIIELKNEWVCNTANLEMLDWSYRWKIRTDIVACESTCILY